jgi:hypothetical protein
VESSATTQLSRITGVHIVCSIVVLEGGRMLSRISQIVGTFAVVAGVLPLCFGVDLRASSPSEVSLATSNIPLGKLPLGVTYNTCTISQDNKHVAYVVKRDGEQQVVVDGVEGKGYDHILDLMFSPDGKRFAFSAMKDSMDLVVVDGVEGRLYYQIRDIYFSPDSRRIAYAALKDAWCIVVVDGGGTKEYQGAKEPDDWNFLDSPLFSPDSQRMAYATERETVILDGVEGRKYAYVGGIRFSPDSKHFCYDAQSGKDWLIVVDGVETSARPDVCRPGSETMAYVATRSAKKLVVLNGVEGTAYDDIKGHPDFSPDGKHMAYIAVRNGRELVVMDGLEGKDYFMVSDLEFSPDSKHMAYTVVRTFCERGHSCGRNQLVVEDGVEGKAYEYIPGGVELDWLKHMVWWGEPVFSPDSKHLAYVAREGGAEFVVVDGLEGGKYEHLRRLIFDSPSQLHTIGFRANEFFEIVIPLIGQ